MQFTMAGQVFCSYFPPTQANPSETSLPCERILLRKRWIPVSWKVTTGMKEKDSSSDLEQKIAQDLCGPIGGFCIRSDASSIKLYLFSIHSAYRLRVAGGAGGNPSWHWARGGIHPGQVARICQGQDTETNNHLHSHSHQSHNLEPLINTICKSVAGCCVWPSPCHRCLRKGIHLLHIFLWRWGPANGAECRDILNNTELISLLAADLFFTDIYH